MVIHVIRNGFMRELEIEKNTPMSASTGFSAYNGIKICQIHSLAKSVLVKNEHVEERSIYFTLSLCDFKQDRAFENLSQ